MTALRSGYLTLYNTCALAGWIAATVFCIKAATTAHSVQPEARFGFPSADTDAGVPGLTHALLPVEAQPFLARAELVVLVLQCAAVLEIVHAAVGLVPGSPLPVIMQVTGRNVVLYFAMSFIPTADAASDDERFAWKPALSHLWGTAGAADVVSGTPKTWAMLWQILAWASAEWIRYPFYLTGLQGLAKTLGGRVITWLRYSTFIVMYPLGFAAEVWVLNTLKHYRVYGMPPIVTSSLLFYQFLAYGELTPF